MSVEEITSSVCYKGEASGTRKDGRLDKKRESQELSGC
jgi:hypothetical protein